VEIDSGAICSKTDSVTDPRAKARVAEVMGTAND
jgi:hypothetical protein